MSLQTAPILHRTVRSHPVVMQLRYLSIDYEISTDKKIISNQS